MAIVIIIASLFVAALTGIASRQRKTIETVSIAASLCSFGAAVAIAIEVASFGTYSFLPLFSVDALGAIIMLAVAAVGVATAFYSKGYLREETAKNIIGFRRVKQYFILFNLFLLAMFFAVATVNPIIMWISIEATTLSTAFLISFYNKPSAMEAAWKYLMVNSVGLLLGFFGTLLYFTSIHGTGLVSWGMLFANAGHLNPAVAKIAFIFVLIGYGTKAGLVPMHTWLPDAHSKAPVPISALLSGVLLNVAFLAIIRFKAVTDSVLGVHFSQTLLIWFGLASIILAAFTILTQKNYKRLLAYSSIENMGIVALGFGFGGLAALAAVLHMVYHALVKPALFLSSGNIFLKYSTTKIKQVRGALAALPITGILFIVGFLAITGVPPSGIFLTEFSILAGGIGMHPVITAVAILAFALVFAGFLKHTSSMMFGERPDDVGSGSGERNYWILIPPLALVIIFICFSFSLPPFLITLLHNAAAAY